MVLTILLDHLHPIFDPPQRETIDNRVNEQKAMGSLKVISSHFFACRVVWQVLGTTFHSRSVPDLELHFGVININAAGEEITAAKEANKCSTTSMVRQAVRRLYPL